MNRYAADDSAGTMTTGHKQHQYQQQQQHFQHRADGGSGDSRRWPAATIRLPRRANKKFPTAADFRKFPDSTQEVGSPDRNLLPPPPPPPSLCYREPFRQPIETCEAVEWDAICKQFARLQQHRVNNAGKYKNGYPQSIPQNHHLQYYNGLHQMHQATYATRNSPYSSRKFGPPPPPPCCKHWQWKPYAGRSVQTFMNKYYLSAPEMYESHAKDMTEEDSLIVLDDEDQLSRSVWHRYVDGRQSEGVYETKMAMWRTLTALIKSRAPDCGLYMVGSTMNGFGGDVSDADFCLLTGCTAADDRHRVCGVQRLQWLVAVLEHQRQSGRDGDRLGASDAHIVYAKVPILRFRWATDGDKTDVDLCCNHAVGIRNTHLLYCYSRLDYRVKPLVLTIKLWASYHNINDPKKMTLSSYSLVLMVINFLQCIKPSVLPSLQHIYGMKFSAETDIGFVHMHEKLPRNSWRSDNSQSLGELLLQFFEYYNNFNFYEKAVSVRTGGLLSLEHCRMAETAKNDPGQWKFIGIEEPFERTNTARSVHNHNAFTQIKEVINKSYSTLKKTKSLDSIFCQFNQ